MSDLTRTRLMALVGANEGRRQAAHTGGHPPIDEEKLLPAADVLLLVAAESDSDAMLFRYTAYGELGGDTWHATVADAQAQASDEYGDALLPWEEVPDDITDAHGYVVQYASDRLNKRGKW